MKKKKLLTGLALSLFILVSTCPSWAALYYPNYGGNSSTLAMGRNDDGSSSMKSLGFDLDFYGNTFDSLYINNNGNVTFNSPMWTYTPYIFPNPGGQPIVAPYFADVDTRPSDGGHVYYDNREVNIGGNTQQEFIVTWDRVGYYSYHTSPLNTFQMIIQNDGDVGFSYGDMGWTRGELAINMQQQDLMLATIKTTCCWMVLFNLQLLKPLPIQNIGSICLSRMKRMVVEMISNIRKTAMYQLHRIRIETI
jgi:hypothetical protein